MVEVDYALEEAKEFTGRYRLSGTKKGDLLLEERQATPASPFTVSKGLKLKFGRILAGLTVVDGGLLLPSHTLVDALLALSLTGGALTALCYKDAHSERREALTFTRVTAYSPADASTLSLPLRYRELLGSEELHEFIPALGQPSRWGASTPELDARIKEALEAETALQAQKLGQLKAEEEVAVKRLYQEGPNPSTSEAAPLKDQVLSPRGRGRGQETVQAAVQGPAARVQLAGATALGTFFLQAEAHGPNSTAVVSITGGSTSLYDDSFDDDDDLDYPWDDDLDAF